jgi:hypothetical protein
MMFKLLLPLSFSLLTSLSIGMPASAELSDSNSSVNYNSSCSYETSTQNSFTSVGNNYNSQRSLLAQVILDTRPNSESACSDYYTIYKNGKTYECHKCTYGGPYCWEKH